MAIAPVQTAALGSASNGASQQTLAFGAPPTVGNYIVAWAWGWDPLTKTSCGFTDTGGNAYTVPSGAFKTVTGDLWVAIGYAKVATAGASFKVTATPVVSSGTYSHSIMVVAVEFSGVASASPVDGAAVGATGTTGIPAPGSLSLTAGDLVVALFSSDQSTYTTFGYATPAGFSRAAFQNNGTSFQVGEAVDAVGPTSPTNPAWKTGTVSWGAAQFALLAATSAASTSFAVAPTLAAVSLSASLASTAPASSSAAVAPTLAGVTLASSFGSTAPGSSAIACAPTLAAVALSAALTTAAPAASSCSAAATLAGVALSSSFTAAAPATSSASVAPTLAAATLSAALTSAAPGASALALAPTLAGVALSSSFTATAVGESSFALAPTLAAATLSAALTTAAPAASSFSAAAALADVALSSRFATDAVATSALTFAPGVADVALSASLVAIAAATTHPARTGIAGRGRVIGAGPSRSTGKGI